MLLFTLLAGADNAGAQTDAGATATPTPTATATPAYALTPTSQSEAAASADQSSSPTFTFPAGMSQDTKDEYRKAVGEIHRFSQQRFGVSADINNLNVNIVNNLSSPGITNPYLGIGRVTININHTARGDRDWQRTLVPCKVRCEDSGSKPIIARGVLAHEYFHAVQANLEGSLYRNRLIPAIKGVPLVWLYEGSAEHFRYAYLNHIGVFDYLDIRDGALEKGLSTDDLLRIYETYNPIRTHGGKKGDGNTKTQYQLGVIAIQYLIEQTDEESLIDYFLSSRFRFIYFRYVDDETIFEEVFGVSVDNFYTSFEAHRASGFPKPGAPLISSDAPPTGEPPTPTPTYTPSPTPTNVPEGVTPEPTPTYTPTLSPTPISSQPSDPEAVFARVSEFEGQMGTLQTLINEVLQAVARLANRVESIETAYPTPTPSPTPTATPLPPGCIRHIGAGWLIDAWSSDCLYAEVPHEGLPGLRYARFYTFTLDAPANVTIRLKSSDVAPYLYLLEGAGKDGAVLYGRWTYTMEHDTFMEVGLGQVDLEAGAYTIVSTTYNPQTAGNFRLELIIPPSAISGSR